MPSRFAVKVFANGFFAVIAIAIVIAFVIDRRDEVLDAVRNDWVIDYMHPLKDEAKAALALERKSGSPKALINLLESPSWEKLRLGDRAYSLKRKMLARLCINLQQQGDYPRLIKWSDVWLSMNDRDLDARAFWFEGIRHIPERESEGLEGLIANYHDFPENHYLHSFLIAAYRDQGDTVSATRMVIEKARSVANDILSGWQVFWTTSDYDNFSKDRSKHLSLRQGEGVETILQFDLPSDAATIRIDAPPKSRLRIHGIETSLGRTRSKVSNKEVKLSQMRRESGNLLAYGREDPYFVLPIKRVGDTDPGAEITVILYLQVNLIIAGYDVPVTELFDET